MVKWIPYFIDVTSVLIWLKIQSSQIAKLSRWQLTTILSAVIYVITVSYLTLAPTSYAFVGTQQVAPLMVGNVPVNLIPFWSTTSDFYQNVLMMLPMGVYISLLRPDFKAKHTVLLGLVVSVGIETLQFILDWSVGLSRWVDINDVLTNTFGVLVGWGLVISLQHTFLKRLIKKFTVDFSFIYHHK